MASEQSPEVQRVLLPCAPRDSAPWRPGSWQRGWARAGLRRALPSPRLSSQVLLPAWSPLLCVASPLQQPFLVSFYLIPPAFLVMVPDCLSCLITDVH